MGGWASSPPKISSKRETLRPCRLRGGAGGGECRPLHSAAAPQSNTVYKWRSFETADGMANLCRLLQRGNLPSAGSRLKAPADKNWRALPATAVPTKGRGAIAPCPPSAKRSVRFCKRPRAGGGQRAAHAPAPIGGGSEDRPNSPHDRQAKQATQSPPPERASLSRHKLRHQTYEKGRDGSTRQPPHPQPPAGSAERGGEDGGQPPTGGEGG